MKISKLFHWLYAFLMFLPIAFLLPTLAYFGFNENATAQEYTKEEPNYYLSNDVTDKEDIILGNIYAWNDNWINTQGYSTMDFYTLDVSLLNFVFGNSSNPIVYGKLLLSGSTSTNAYVYVEYSNNAYNYISISEMVFYFIPLTKMSGYANMPSEFVSCIGVSEFLWVKDYTEVTYTMGITESVNQSILDTFDLPMFSWTSDNFIIAPFNYITDLFGLPSDNVVNKYLDYWLTISIVYLCFDVIMYVPLLAHRWLDKGIVE